LLSNLSRLPRRVLRWLGGLECKQSAGHLISFFTHFATFKPLLGCLRNSETIKKRCQNSRNVCKFLDEGILTLRTCSVRHQQEHQLEPAHLSHSRTPVSLM
jgi:hypothetical protein